MTNKRKNYTTKNKQSDTRRQIRILKQSATNKRRLKDLQFRNTWRGSFKSRILRHTNTPTLSPDEPIENPNKELLQINNDFSNQEECKEIMVETSTVSNTDENNPINQSCQSTEPVLRQNQQQNDISVEISSQVRNNNYQEINEKTALYNLRFLMGQYSEIPKNEWLTTNKNMAIKEPRTLDTLDRSAKDISQTIVTKTTDISIQKKQSIKKEPAPKIYEISAHNNVSSQEASFETSNPVKVAPSSDDKNSYQNTYPKEICGENINDVNTGKESTVNKNLEVTKVHLIGEQCLLQILRNMIKNMDKSILESPSQEFNEVLQQMIKTMDCYFQATNYKTDGLSSSKDKPGKLIGENENKGIEDVKCNNNKSNCNKTTTSNCKVSIKQCIRRRQFGLPKKYDPNNTRWTLKYHKFTPKLVELMPDSKVYVKRSMLANAKRIAKDYKAFARLLLTEIFSQNALRMCTLTGARSNAFSVRPGLDEKARLILMIYVENFGREKGWGVFDGNAVEISLRNRLQFLRHKYCLKRQYS